MLRQKAELSERERERADRFILSGETNGEFINSFMYLEYHPTGRFIDDSIVVTDSGSGDVVGCMMAVQKDRDTVVSHSGTTFAGPVMSRRAGIKQKEEILDCMLHYYESKYKEIHIRLAPGCYSIQPNDTIPYLLLRRGFSFDMMALANVVNISDIRTEDDVLRLFKSGRRNHVKKALKEGKFYVEKDEIPADIWNHMDENLRKKFESRTTHTLEEIKDLQTKFPENIRPFSVYTENNEYGAFALVFCFKNVFHTQYLDVNYELSGSYPNLFLTYKLIMEARRLHYRYISFGSSTEDCGRILNYGLYNYKDGYGGGDIILPLYVKGENHGNKRR